MVADHYKISVEHVVLIVNNQIVHGNTELHVLFYPPIVLRRIMWVIGQAATSGDLFSYVPDCQSLKHCELAKKACDDPNIKQLVDKRGDAWVVILNAFKFGDDVKTDTKKQ